MPNLTIRNLANNNLDGPFPDLSDLKKLVALNLSRNRLAGYINSILHLKSLRFVFLQKNIKFYVCADTGWSNKFQEFSAGEISSKCIGN